MITINATEQDDVQFVGMVTAILNNAVNHYRPKEIYLIHIDHCFDRKWQKFTGKALGAVGRWNSILTIPPFDPSRVLSQKYFRSDEVALSSYRLDQGRPLHLQQTSNYNLHRYIKQVSESGLFLWYSGETKKHDVASVLLYQVEEENTFDFYASFKRAVDWKLNRVRGLSRHEMEDMMKALPTGGI